MTSVLYQERKPKYDLNVNFLGQYYRKNLKRNDAFSDFVLRIKKGERDAIRHAAELLKDILPDNAYVCVVPSSKVGRRNNMSVVLEVIEKEKKLHICEIKRTKDIGKKATGEGRCSYLEERESLLLMYEHQIDSNDIYLLDDITTTGVSFAASRDLLKESGAAAVYCIAMGSTVSAADFYNSEIIALLKVRGLGRKYASEILDMLDMYNVEDDKQIYEKLLIYSRKRKSISVPDYDQFCRYIEEADSILRQQAELGIIAINKYSNNYPKKFKDILAPPVILFAKGRVSLLHGFKHIAVVGSRNVTPYGRRLAYRLGELFGEDNIVVSGLAKGCDTYGHRGCLAANGKTVAILPSPVSDPMPKVNRELADEIASSKGLLLSEYYLGQKVEKGYYVARDRLQSALSDAVVVVETKADGGTMHTVEYCRDNDRLLACCKYPARYMDTDQLSGNRSLLKSGALQISGKEDLDFFFDQLDKKREELENSDLRQEQMSIELRL